MSQCNHYQSLLLLRPDATDAGLELHLQTCPPCARAAQRAAAFDTAVRTALLPPVPTDLTARLLALVPGLATAAPAHPPRWYRQRRLFLMLCGLLTVLALGIISFGVYSLALTLGDLGVWTTLQHFPGAALGWLYAQVPISKSVVQLFRELYQPILWSLLLVLFWLVLERYALRPNPRQLVGSGG